MIHDAARPNFSLKLLNKLYKELKSNDCIIPAIQTTDSIKYKSSNKVINIKRENIYLIQTPQAFNYKKLYKLQNDKGIEITDDANLFIRAGKKIKIIKGEVNNNKITISSDIKTNNLIKYGLGFDVHRLVPNKKLFLGGINIPSALGTLGHSDGDPVLHAIIDAVLGACNMGDIGEKFSDKSKKFKNVRSTILLNKIIYEVKSKGYLINNIDINIITQKPKIQKYKKQITNCIAKICNILPAQINIKGKTTEKLGVIGKEKAIACEAIASVIKYD
jgi:2-C-methyl-D-erythritol 4-phosphate cytidylyltransferase/2-C-methyl-D-erythritol 2,4-cyclodiphosphate synthase